MWGDNDHGQLGLSSAGDVTRPRQVTAPSGGHVVDADGGTHHTLVLTEGGGICTAGSNSFGQFGDGSAGSAGRAFFTCGLFP